MSLATTDWALLLSAGAGTACWIWLSRRPVEPGDTKERDSFCLEGEAARSPSSRHLPVLKAAALLSHAGCGGLVAKINQRLGFTAESYERDVVPLLDSLAEFVQLLPASEGHHHAQPGGLLVHLLEVASHALHFRDAYKLPRGASPDEQMRLAARYSYAVLVAALLHDIGKPVSDVDIQLVTEQGAVGPWVPLGGSMVQQGGAWYAVEFPVERDYRRHERMALPLLHAMVPAKAMAWLGEHRPVMEELVQVLSGDPKGSLLAEIVKQADQKSVADNLLAGPRTRFATARAVPLIERLMGALRRQLVEGQMVLNRAGAAGFCDGQHLWCVSGTVADAVRDYLNRTEERQPGAAGIPEDNSRLFDTWQEYGACEVNESRAAIWRVQVTIGVWTQSLTVLKFPLSKLFADPAQYPQALPAGAVVPISVGPPTSPKSVESAGDSSREAPCEVPVDAHSDPIHAQAERDPTLEQHEALMADAELMVDDMEHAFTVPVNSEGISADAELGLAGHQQQSPRDVEHMQPKAALPAAADDGYLDEADAALLPSTGPERPPPPELMTGPVSPASKVSANLAALATDTPRKANVERFMAWIQAGIANGTITYNEANAAVHFCHEGMLLVSPRIFREYADQFEARVDLPDGSAAEPWRVLQQQFQKSGYPTKAPRHASGGGTFLHRYNVAGPGGKQLVGNIVPQPQRFFDPVPPVNPLLRLPVSIEQQQGPAIDREALGRSSTSRT